MSNNRWLEKKRSFVVVTGASRGVGKVLAIKLARLLGDDSVLALLARNLDGLNETKRAVEEAAPWVRVVVRAVDLGRPHAKEFSGLIGSLLELPAEDSSFEQAMIIHNAASLGRFSSAEEAGVPQEWADYLALNVTSPICLNAEFLKLFKPSVVSRRLVINITSVAAVHPLPTAPFYNTGKAARECFFKTLASDDASVKVLNYSPGPVDTDMFQEVLTNITQPEGKKMFQDIASSDRFLTCETTVSKLLDILDKDVFESGCRIDYFD